MTDSRFCTLCRRETPPPLLLAYETPGSYALRLRTGNYFYFSHATPAGEFALLHAPEGDSYVRVRDVIWSVGS